MIPSEPNRPEPKHFTPDRDDEGKFTRADKPIRNVFLTAVGKVMNPLLYPGAGFIRNFVIDNDRENNAKRQLLIAGGEPVKLHTPDGDILDGMYLSTAFFKEKLTRCFDLVERPVEGHPDRIQQTLVLKREFCDETHSNEETRLVPKKHSEAELLFSTLRGLGASAFPFGRISEHPLVRGPCINLDEIEVDTPLCENASSQPTVLIVEGSAMNYGDYKGLALAYLLKGINVLLFDIRGYGESSGTPTETKSYIDIDTCYQYLTKEKGIKNNNLIIHGHSLGGALATSLAARMPETHLIIDRSFADFPEIAGQLFPSIQKVVKSILSKMVTYSPALLLDKVTGHILVVEGANDGVIPTQQREKLRQHLSENENHVILEVPFGHVEQWTNDPESATVFDTFLKRANLKRRLFYEQ